MIPFLILSMVDIILSGTVGIVVVVALFHIHIVHGVVSLAVYLVSTPLQYINTRFSNEDFTIMGKGLLLVESLLSYCEIITNLRLKL